jgi:hypothetical protein
MLGLAATAEACGMPRGEVVPDSPAARATDIRRTAVAAVQQLIANNPTATPAPAATPTPAPTCPGAIWWTEARSHLREPRTIQGIVVGIRLAPNGASLLEIGQPYPDPNGVSVLVPGGAASALDGKNVCVTGSVSLVRGEALMEISDSANIHVID